MKRIQPSNLTLLVTAGACATVLAWACRDGADQASNPPETFTVETPSLTPLEGEADAWPPPAAIRLDPPSYAPPGPSGQGAAEVTALPAAPHIYRLPPPLDGHRQAAPAHGSPSLANVALWPTLPPRDPGAPAEVSYAPAEGPAGDDANPGDESEPQTEARHDTRVSAAGRQSTGEHDTDVTAEPVEAPREFTGEAIAHQTAAPPADEAAEAAARMSHDEMLSYTPAATGVSERVADEVRAAFALGRNGALYAARQQFIDAMKAIAAAKDAAESTERHARALSQGLTALDEAEDFLPRGEALEAGLSVTEIASSHRTPMLSQTPDVRLAHEAAALYYRYAEEKLAMSVRGERAGSMALYGLGKTYARLADLDESRTADKRSLSMHRAALMAHRENHLAANELGVGLARAGRLKRAAKALEHAASMGGGSTVYRNLAHVQNELGQTELAAATTEHAERLAERERQAGAFSRARGVEWVSPDRFARRPGAPATGAPTGPAQTPVAEQGGSPWDSVVQFAKRLAGDAPPEAATPAIERNPVAPPVRSRTTVR